MLVEKKKIVKNKFYLLVVLSTIISCNSDSDSDSDNEIDSGLLIGKWIWEDTFIKNDDSEYDFEGSIKDFSQKIVELSFNNKRYSIIENNIEVSRGNYEIIEKKSSYTKKEELYISYSTELEKEYRSLFVSLNGFISVLDNENLVISSDNEGGFESHFIRVE